MYNLSTYCKNDQESMSLSLTKVYELIVEAPQVASIV